MGLLSGQTTTLLEGNCYDYLMNQFCEDLYFEIYAKHPNRDLIGVINMYTVGHIIGGDMTHYMQHIFDKAPEGFQDYLVQNKYITLEQITITAPEINCVYYDPMVAKYGDDDYISSKQYIIPEIVCNTELYFTWKLKELFWRYDELSHINDVIINEKPY